MRLIKSVTTVGFYTILSRIMGLFRDRLIASVLGAGPMADAFHMAFKFPNFFRRLFGEGALGAAFIPTFSSLLSKEGPDVARRAASDVFSVLVISLLILVIFVLLTIPWLMYVIAPGFSATPERFDLAIQFTRITFPYIFFASLAAFYTGVLNTLYKFAVGAAAPILLNVTMIIALLFFDQVLQSPGHVLSWAVSIAGVGQMAWLMYSCRANGFHLTFHRPKLTPAVRKVLRLMVPGALAAGVIQFNIMIGNAFLSFLPSGAVSYFFYADRLNQLPISLVGVSISTALLPSLSKQVASGMKKTVHVKLNRAMEVSMFLILPASIALLILSEPIIKVIYEQGEFTRDDTIQTAKILSCFSLGLPAYVLVKIFSSTFFARHDTRTPLIAASFAVATNVALNFILIGPLAHVGIALATSTASWVNAGWLAYRLSIHKYFIADARLKNVLPRILLACLLLGAGVQMAQIYLSDYLNGSEGVRTIALSIIVFSGFSIYMLAATLFKAVDLNEYKSLLSRGAKLEK